jgi:hypothetical protein
MSVSSAPLRAATSKATVRLLAAAASWIFAGCGDTQDTANREGAATAFAAPASLPAGTRLVTGQPGSPSALIAQAKSAVNVSTDPSLPGGQVITVAFNEFGDDSQPLAYATSTDRGATWTYTNFADGVDSVGVPLPFLQGSPEIASSPSAPTVVYVADLATNSTMSTPWAFRSSDGGQHFDPFVAISLPLDDTFGCCDSVSIAVGNDGTLYLASRSDHDLVVWAIDTTGKVTLLPRPDIASYGPPRIRFSAAGDTLYLMTRSQTGYAMMAMPASSRTWGPAVNVGGGSADCDIGFASGPIHCRARFSFDVADLGTARYCAQEPVCILPNGTIAVLTTDPDACTSRGGHVGYKQNCASYDNSGTAVRIAYVDATKDKTFIRATACSDALTNCQDIPAWSTAQTPGDQFDPVIRAYPTGSAFPIVELSYLSREADPTGSSFQVMAARLAFNDPAKLSAMPLAPVSGTTGEACPLGTLLRDYNDLAALPPPPGGKLQFVRTLTASPADCSALPHVGMTTFD